MMTDTENELFGAVLVLLLRRGQPTDLSMNIVGAVTAVVACATIATVLRFYVRRYLLRQWGIDDWAAMFSYVCSHRLRHARLGG